MDEADFYRQYSAEILISEKLQIMNVDIGARGPIDPESGMSVSLPLMEELIPAALKTCKNKNFSETTQFAKTLWTLLAEKLPLQQIRVEIPMQQELHMQGPADFKLWHLWRVPVNLSGDQRLLEFAGGVQPLLSVQSFAKIADLLSLLQEQKWSGEVRDLLGKKTYRLS